MESTNATEFFAGYRAALTDLEQSHPGWMSDWISVQRKALDSIEQRLVAPVYGCDFCRTIIGSGTGPQDGLRRGAHAS